MKDFNQSSTMTYITKKMSFWKSKKRKFRNLKSLKIPVKSILCEAVKKMEKLIDMLEENDDVQNVYHTWEMPEEEE